MPSLRLRSAFFIVALVSCTSEGAPRPATVELAIVGGEPDANPERYPGVVKLVDRSGCTGTLIAVDGTTGWVLTAAHCVVHASSALVAPTSMRVLIGPDIRQARSFRVTRFAVHPTATSIVRGADLAMVAFEGADDSLRPLVIPVLDPAEDRILAGAPVRYAGFGRTTLQGSSSPIRMRGEGVITSLERTLTGDAVLVRTGDGTGAFPCKGDSGGPWLVSVDGGFAVAGVTSYDSGGCGRRNGAARVSAAVRDFIEPTLRGAPPRPTSGCSACGLWVATDEAAACHAAYVRARDVAADYAACLENNGGPEACATCSPRGAEAFDAYESCLLGDDCRDACTAGRFTEAYCALDFDDTGPCNACVVRSECCDHVARCMRNASCASCFQTRIGDVACENVPLYVTARECLVRQSRCSGTCSGPFRRLQLVPDGGLPSLDGGVAPPEGGFTVACERYADAGLAVVEPPAPPPPASGGCSTSDASARRTTSTTSSLWWLAAFGVAWLSRRNGRRRAKHDAP